MKTTELAKILNVSPMTIRRMAKESRIPGAKTTKGGHYYFPRSEAFKDWLKTATATPEQQSMDFDTMRKKWSKIAKAMRSEFNERCFTKRQQKLLREALIPVHKILDDLQADPLTKWFKGL